MQLFDELMQLAETLEREAVPYALAGGLAVAVWGAPRATKDIDLLVRAEDVGRAKVALAARGFDIVALPMVFRDGMELHRVSRAEAGSVLTVDLIVVSVALEPAWVSRVRTEAAGRALWVVSRDALIAMKAAAARPIDIADIEKLRELDR